MKLFWLDLETTGLVPTHDSILEIAIVEADLMDPFTIDPSKIVSDVLQFDPETEMDDFVRGMHTRNGLLERCRVSDRTILDAQERLLALVPEVTTKDDMPILAGSSIHFDAAFLRVHMPALAKRFSHRLYDVSAIKLFCQSLGMPKFKKVEAHRAADDIMESVMHGRQCLEWLRERL